ncbi:Spy/CpxP family protein refolding chaperone [Entomobacter blattae]|uniref:Periplasmic heavy metal sensor n=1 Tax=Entomobacter blattae TaxID=2762277 RepID=A0A7H1NSS4_9PROT|nr:Spy/CpxP family protein refolding chaperone [Entomobacter blattae]QNT78834.1 hypothetical protein JGUZn3_16120 [Entomobacter blattae]
MIKKIVFSALIASGTILGSTTLPAHAQEMKDDMPSSRMGMMRHGKDHAMMMAALHGTNLTKEQKEKIKTVMNSAEEQIKPLKEEKRAIGKKIAEGLTASGAVDQAALTALAEKSADLSKRIEMAKLDCGIKMHDVLTAEQRTRVKTNLENMEKLHEKMQSLRKEMHETMHGNSSKN